MMAKNSTSKKFNLLVDVPLIDNRKELKMWLKPLYIISDYMHDRDGYSIFMQKTYNILKGCFVIRECREYPIRFKFYRDDEETYELQFRHFIINLMVWQAFVEVNDLQILDGSFILNCFDNIPCLDDYINTKIINVLRDCHIKSTAINYACSEVLYYLRKISEDFSIILGLNFSAPMFIELYNDDPELRELMECTFPDNMQPHEIEEKLQEFEDLEIKLLKDKPNNNLGVVLRANTGIKHKQLREFTISEGLKPTIDGVTIPLAIENSTLIKGIDRPSYHYLDAMGSRKSLVMNKKVMGNAGYFGKIVLMLARTLSVSQDVSDCNTKHLIHYQVKNDKILKKLNGKYFKRNKEDSLEILNAKTMKDLIGETIMVRSPVTCACGDKVCPRCIGRTSVMNDDIADGFSAFESEEITKVVNQSILSAKHLLTTNSEVITFNAPFYLFFTIIGGEINPNVNNNEFVDNILDYAIYISPTDLVKENEMDDDSMYNTYIYNGNFYVKNLKDPDEEPILIKPDTEKEIFLTDYALSLMKKGKGYIKFKDLDDDDQIFEMNVLNNELTRPLYMIMDLINKARKDSVDETIDTIIQEFLELLIESGINASVVAAELIINRLIRSVKHPYQRPDFTKEELEPYSIYTVRRALEKNKSPLIGISYQNIKRQFLSDDLYTERDGSSYIDEFYRINIPTENLKMYSDLARKHFSKK